MTTALPMIKREGCRMPICAMQGGRVPVINSGTPVPAAADPQEGTWSEEREMNLHHGADPAAVRVMERCPAQTGPVWKTGGERCGCILPKGHEVLPRIVPDQIDGPAAIDHRCDCGAWWVDSCRRDPATA